MIVSAHQPHFLPWLGYINKIDRSDTFIWLDTVQYRKNYFQNRCRIRWTDGREQWLTVPVRASSDTAISDVKIADPGWNRRTAMTLQQAYGKAPYFKEYWPSIEEALLRPHEGLSEVSWHLLMPVLSALGLERVRLVRASEMAIEAEDPNERLTLLCRAVGASTYLAGRGGHKYMDVEVFAKAGVSICWQEFDPSRTAYSRDGKEEDILGFSVIDALFHVGAERTLALARRGWSPEPGCE